MEKKQLAFELAKNTKVPASIREELIKAYNTIIDCEKKNEPENIEFAMLNLKDWVDAAQKSLVFG